MKMKYLSVVAAAVLAIAAASVNAQTVQVAMIGSSAIFNELGQAAGQNLGCIWFDTGKTFTATDARPGSMTPAQPSLTDTGAGWVAWNANGGTCAAPNAGYVIYFDINTDSTVGNRCFFGVQASGNPGCVVTTSATGDPATGTFGNSALPTVVAAAINAGGGTSINAAATDIRPEDAEFATIRALTACGQVVSGQYLGLGYASQVAATPTGILGVSIAGSTFNLGNITSPGSFNVAAFNLEGTDPFTGQAVRTFNVIPVGAVPIVVFVNPSDTAGFGSLQVTNVDRAVLAGYLDGTLGRTQDMIAQTYTSGGVKASETYVREPLSGTYNTMEFNVPNSQQNQTSMDVGLASLNNAGQHTHGPVLNCVSGGVNNTTGATATVLNNPLHETALHGGPTVGRDRVIGTGNMVKAVTGVADSLGYAFWSAANFASATAANAKYVTVDGLDPIQQDWTDGLVPTSNNDLLGNVTMTHVKDGGYPIWSLLRVECDSSIANDCTNVQTLVNDAQTLLTPFQPDFVPTTQLAVLRSHFAPPTVSFPCSIAANTPANGNPGTSEPECGGDVGGMVYSQQSDGDYLHDNSSAQGGIVGRRN